MDKTPDPVQHICDIPYERLPQDVLNFLKSIPIDLEHMVLQLFLQKPDKRLLCYFETETAIFTVWSKHEIAQKDLNVGNWNNFNVPVRKQGPHGSCWCITVAENISDARFYNVLDATFTQYSDQFLLDFVDDKRSLEEYVKSLGSHSCSGNSPFNGLMYAMINGIPLRTDWRRPGCNMRFRPNRDLSLVKRKHVLNDVKAFSDLDLALRYLKIQPLIASIAVFSPDLSKIGRNVYRGPTHKDSRLTGWHAVSVRTITIEDGETIAHIKNSHGSLFGNQGYFRLSLDVNLVELKTKTPDFQSPDKLIRTFYYGEARSKYEKRVIRSTIEGFVGKKEQNRYTIECTAGNTEHQNHMAYLIFEGIFHNTAGHVYQTKDKNGRIIGSLTDLENEIIGSPTDRALFKWAIQWMRDIGFTYSKLDSTTIKGSPSNSKRQCIGTAVDCQKVDNNDVRIHWKGSAYFILNKCTKLVSEDEYIDMSEPKRNNLKDKIDKMVADKLICIAIAFKEFERKDLPPKKKIKQWQLPCENLTLLTIFGIKNPCILPEDEVDVVDQAPLDFEDLDDTKKSPSIGNIMPPHDGINWLDFEKDSALPWEEGYDVGVIIKPNLLSTFYDIGLCGRLGLYCHNVQQGTEYEYKSVSKLYTQCGLFAKLFITVEATKSPADCLPFTFETCVMTDDLAESDQLQWETCFCSVEGSKEEDNQWDNEVLADHYKGELPKWFSYDNHQQRYVVKKSELMDKDNKWLYLFTEFAFYTKWRGSFTPIEIMKCLPLEIRKVVVETRGEAETEAREKLKGENAIFYISFECENYPVKIKEPLKKRTRYRAVVRKTMDGKPGHMRLEVRCWEYPI